jgi:hypothetical protein
MGAIGCPSRLNFSEGSHRLSAGHTAEKVQAAGRAPDVAHLARLVVIRGVWEHDG